MQIWNFFLFFALAAMLFWSLGAFFSWKGKKALAVGATVAGLAVFLSYVIVLWTALDRPPMRTMGETRLWYSLFLPLMGLIVYSRWNYKWLLSFSTVLAAVFITINLLKPEIHSKTMMPALQSPWFAPHVIIYMMAYALLGAAFVMAAYLLFFHHHQAPSDKEWTITDNLVYVGWASSPLACSPVPCGPRWHGATTGRGILRRHGRQPRGSPIWFIYIIGCGGRATCALPCGCSSSTSRCCRCAGGASTTCRQRKEPVCTRIT